MTENESIFKLRCTICTLFFLLVGAGGLMSFWRILRHIRVMFSTTTGVFMFTDIRNRLRAVTRHKQRWDKRQWSLFDVGISRKCGSFFKFSAVKAIPLVALLCLKGFAGFSCWDNVKIALNYGFKRNYKLVLPQRRRSSQHPPSLEMESVSSSISYWRLLTCEA